MKHRLSDTCICKITESPEPDSHILTSSNIFCSPQLAPAIPDITQRLIDRGMDGWMLKWKELTGDGNEKKKYSQWEKKGRWGERIA